MNYHVKNGSWRDKAFRVHGGMTIVAAGAEQDVETAEELSDEQIAVLAKDGCEVEPLDGADKPLAENTVAKLKAIAAAESIDLGDATAKADIIAAIELARGV